MFLKSKLIDVNHGFFTRNGGVSAGVYGSLNCGPGSGDDLKNVEHNRELVRKAVGADELVTARQCHSDIAIVVNSKSEGEGAEVDALVTNKKSLAVGVLTADCTPILLYDREAQVVAAVHAGWRGARFGVISSALRAMQNLGAENIVAAIGPCIHQDSYEVSEEFTQVFAAETGDNGKYFKRTPNKEGHYQFDLPSYVEFKLKKNGVAEVDNLNEDTLSQPKKFFSYRRNTLEGTKDYGRQISVICLSG